LGGRARSQGDPGAKGKRSKGWRGGKSGRRGYGACNACRQSKWASALLFCSIGMARRQRGGVNENRKGCRHEGGGDEASVSKENKNDKKGAWSPRAIGSAVKRGVKEVQGQRDRGAERGEGESQAGKNTVPATCGDRTNGRPLVLFHWHGKAAVGGVSMRIESDVDTREGEMK
jgi:hypothetical protein